MKKILLAGGLFFSLLHPVLAQHQDIPERPGIWKGKNIKSTDSTSLLYAFRSGTAHGHIRYYFMATDNRAGLTDYFANAAGGGLRYETGRFKGFQAGISGFFIFNIGSSDFTKNDSLTNQPSRYELGLFDVEDGHNKYDLDRLEELFIKYNFRKSHIEFGKILINTPLINLQDGRMRPSGVEGLWFDINELKNTRFEGGFLYGFSPRGTVKWYQGGKSIGVFPQGLNPDGTPSNYLNNIKSAGTAVLGIHYNPNPILKIQVWDYYIENVLNTAMLQTDFTFQLKNKSKLFTGMQFIRQDAINNGGNADPSKTYVRRGNKSMTIGGTFGWKDKNWETSLNYNHITAHGRYLFPREWGRDPFYTFLPRERSEGFGNVHALVGKVNYFAPKIGIKASLGGGYIHMPDAKNASLNKYGMPSYGQINADVRYAFNGFLRGFDIQLLVVGKIKAGETYNNPRYEFNKVNMMLYNLVFNFHF
ncbi:MAG: OprD family outer membrane porin [Flavobacteriales bacterium]|nr:OprD family outer membrane porin [Flavobacteriales bacterium]